MRDPSLNYIDASSVDEVENVCHRWDVGYIQFSELLDIVENRRELFSHYLLFRLSKPQPGQLCDVPDFFNCD